MKTLTYLCIFSALILGSTRLHADDVQIDVQSNFFMPGTATLNLGDMITWTWSDGNHTTTSVNIPEGAPMWDQPINSSSVSYSYTPSVAGTYTYECSIHATMGMIAAFTVVDPTPVSEAEARIDFDVTVPVTGYLKVDYYISEDGMMSLRLFDLVGREVKSLVEGNYQSGEFTRQFDVASLKKGIYIVSMHVNNSTLTKKIYLQ